MAKGKGQTGETVEIYALKHPLTGEIRYVGKANDTRKRLASHLRDSRRRNTPVYCWIRKLAEQGLAPIAEVIEICGGDWKEAEIRLIAQYQANGHKLLNLAVGGDEPHCPIEIRRENGRKNARSIHDNPARRKLWELKKMMGEDLRFFKKWKMKDVYNKNVRRCKEFAARYPELFSSWASLEEM